jgi:hypothetical protein
MSEKKIVYPVQGENKWLFFCPGCRCGHFWQTAPATPTWTWNEDYENPTVSPSILVQHSKGEKDIRCHVFIREGKIEFLNDCTHEFAGQTVQMEEY